MSAMGDRLIAAAELLGMDPGDLMDRLDPPAPATVQGALDRAADSMVAFISDARAASQAVSGFSMRHHVMDRSFRQGYSVPIRAALVDLLVAVANYPTYTDTPRGEDR